MNARTLVLLLGVAALVGGAVGSHVQRNARTRLETEKAELSSRLAAARQTQEQATLERDHWKNQAQTIDRWSEEVQRLRAELVRLKGEQAAPPAPQKDSSGSAKEGLMDVKRAATAGIQKGIIPLEDAPPAIAAAIETNVGTGRVKVSMVPTEDGKITFGAKGELPDGRAIALRLAEDGSVLEKSTEILPEAIPAHIQTPIANAFGGIPLSGAREIIDQKQVLYEVASKGPDARMQITVRGDGVILGYTAKLRLPEHP